MHGYKKYFEMDADDLLRQPLKGAAERKGGNFLSSFNDVFLGMSEEVCEPLSQSLGGLNCRANKTETQ